MAPALWISLKNIKVPMRGSELPWTQILEEWLGFRDVRAMNKAPKFQCNPLATGLFHA